jgi:anthranilate synthase component I, non-proteobacterial lineages
MHPPIQPTPDEFSQLAHDYNVVTVWCELVADVETPVSVYRKLRNPSEPSFLLESAEHSDHVGRHSFVGAGARWTFTAHDRTVTARDAAGDHRTYEAETDPFRELEEAMKGFRVAPQAGVPIFRGGAVGYLAYDAVRWFEPVIPAPPKDELGVPDMFFLLTDVMVAFDHRRRRMKVMANAFLEGTTAEAAYEEACARVRSALGKLAQPVAFSPVFAEAEGETPGCVSNTTREQFHAIVETAKEYIRAGDIFQMVPSQRFETPFEGDPLDLYRALRFVNPSPYMFCFEIGGGFSLVGSSPEVHVRVTDGLVEIRPIAGTRRRGETEEEDLALEADLLADPKERAEHLMLVDLARNDVGRIAEFASVKVSDFMTIERYSHVMHIVSHVSGTLAGGRSAYDVMRATFPAGTVSGSPKVRAMQIINELEQSKRCVYAGAVGWFGFDGNLDSCIALRTVVLKDGVAYVQAGGGVVADSTPEGEYQESVNKAMAAMRAIARAKEI